MHKAAAAGQTMGRERRASRTENRKEMIDYGNRKPQQQLQESDLEPHVQPDHQFSATNEHKHPNQYTKGADDESAKNSTSSRSSNAKNSR